VRTVHPAVLAGRVTVQLPTGDKDAEHRPPAGKRRSIVTGD